MKFLFLLAFLAGINRLQSIGVKDRETNPEIRTAIMIVTPNSLNTLPIIPDRKRIGIKTATSERVIEMIVRLMSLEPCKAPSQLV